MSDLSELTRVDIRKGTGRVLLGSGISSATAQEIETIFRETGLCFGLAEADALNEYRPVREVLVSYAPPSGHPPQARLFVQPAPGQTLIVNEMTLYQCALIPDYTERKLRDIIRIDDCVTLLYTGLEVVVKPHVPAEPSMGCKVLDFKRKT